MAKKTQAKKELSTNKVKTVKRNKKLLSKVRQPRRKLESKSMSRRRRPQLRKNKSVQKNASVNVVKGNVKGKGKVSSIKKEEEEIEFIENENELFDDNGYYKGKDDPALVDWSTNNQTTVNLSEMLFQKMNDVEEKKLDPRIIEAYTIVGDILSKYTSGKLPKAFNILPSTENWEELVDITNPQKWTPNAMYEATVMFSSGFNAPLAEQFYLKYLLPAVREDIKVNKKLNVHYYNCLKRALFKPAGFFKGIILPLSNSTNAKEASIVGSILRKCSIPMSHSSACIMKLMEFCKKAQGNLSMGALFFMKILLLKKYAMPTPVKEQIVKFFYEYLGYSTRLPVLWHQVLLIFIQHYKFDLTEEEKSKLKILTNAQNHHLITEEIIRELNFVPPKFSLGIINNSIKSDMAIDS